ncbi:thiamine phosphate synthase [Parapedobacter deserti]
MQLTVITREDFFKREADIINGLFQTGLTDLHLRKPGASVYEMRTLLRAIDTGFHKQIIIHGHDVLYREFGLLGVHLRLDILLEKRRMQDIRLISCSTHTPAEVAAVAGLADRAFISPVFNSISKKGYRSNAALLAVPKPEGKTRWVALGGITPARLHAVHRHGYRNAALLGYIWEGEHPQQRFQACQAVAARLPAVAPQFFL